MVTRILNKYGYSPDFQDDAGGVALCGLGIGVRRPADPIGVDQSSGCSDRNSADSTPSRAQTSEIN